VGCSWCGHTVMLPSMSLKVKPTGEVAQTGSRSRALVLVSLGTALVLVTYVTRWRRFPRPPPTSGPAAARAPGSSAR
jgi:hypothetical protein